MARKPNYRFERQERERRKAEKKAAKAKAKAEKVGEDGTETPDVDGQAAAEAADADRG